MNPSTIAERLQHGPVADPAFAKLDFDARQKVLHRLEAMRTACSNASAIGSAVENFALLIGVPCKTARRIWDNVLASGWRGAMDGRALRAQDNVSRRIEFIKFWKGLCERHNRSNRSAWHDLVMLWKSGEVIPGYDEVGGHPKEGMGGVPDGWTYGNLCKHAPTKKELVLARVGRKRFEADSTSLWTTRVGVRCGQCYQFDDVWGDVKVFFGRQFVRPLELGCIDLASTKRVMFGLCPQVREDDKKTNLKERYMVWLALGLLSEVGYHEDGCTLIVEHGTAAIRDPLEQALLQATRDKVTIQRSGICDKPKMLGWYAGEGGGNPRMKGVLESLHHLYHSRVGMLPAQTGSNSRIDKPEHLAALEKYGKRLMTELEKFPAGLVDELLSKLILPGLTLSRYHEMLFQFYQVIDGRDTHDLEGWEKSGFVKARWRLNENDCWHDQDELANLDERQIAVWRSVVESKPGLIQPVRLSPNEVWARRDRMKRIPQHALPGLLGPEMGREVTLRSRCIEFNDAEIDPDGLRYSSMATDPFGLQVLLKEGEKYLAFVNPFRPGSLLVTDGRGRYIGAAARIDRVQKLDQEAVFKAIGRSAHEQTVRMQQYRDRHAGDVTAHQEMLEHNDLVLQGARKLRPVSATAPSQGGLGDIFGAKEKPQEETVEHDGTDTDGLAKIYGGTTGERE